jgi:hypothetical protein
MMYKAIPVFFEQQNGEIGFRKKIYFCKIILLIITHEFTDLGILLLIFYVSAPLLRGLNPLNASSTID